MRINLDTVEYVGIDLDDTLYDRDFVYTNTFSIMEMEVLRTGVSFDEFNKIYQYYSLIEFQKFTKGEKDNFSYKIDRVKSTYNELGEEITYEQALIFHSLYEYFRRNIVLRPDVKEFISLLKKQEKKVFILTNGPENDQMQKIKTLGLDEMVSENLIFTSGEIGYSKPDKRVFDHIENALGAEGDNILYIGDHIENDLIGCQGNDWVPVYYDFADNESDEFYSVQTFSDLIDFFSRT